MSRLVLFYTKLPFAHALNVKVTRGPGSSRGLIEAAIGDWTSMRRLEEGTEPSMALFRAFAPKWKKKFIVTFLWNSYRRRLFFPFSLRVVLRIPFFFFPTSNTVSV